MLQEWLDRLAAELGLPDPSAIDVDAVLDLARDTAHGVDRPAAPLSAFVVGYAAGLRGGGREVSAELLATASALAREWGERADTGSRSAPGAGSPAETGRGSATPGDGPARGSSPADGSRA